MALPSTYKPSTGMTRYLKFKEAGAYRFRILSDIIEGWEGWYDKKPARAVSKLGLPDNVLWDTEPKHFLAMVVLDRNAETKMEDDDTINPIKILEITQGSIKKALFDLEHNGDWGDSKGYDITVTKSGEGMESRYATIASPHKKLTKAIEDLYKKEKINLGALFTGDNPFESVVEDDLDILDEIIS
jgi:hypothetical protein